MVKICVMLWLTTILSCATYFFPAMNLGNKIESLVGCFTAVIAFLFVINDKLPKTPFLHKVRLYAKREVRGRHVSDTRTKTISKHTPSPRPVFLLPILLSRCLTLLLLFHHTSVRHQHTTTRRTHIVTLSFDHARTCTRRWTSL